MALEYSVETRFGVVTGTINDGVGTFKGIPYAASAAGENRFMPPHDPMPWSGKREALTLPPQCPQPLDAGAYADPDIRKLMQGCAEPEPYHVDEDCLALNIWSPNIDQQARLPVMLWCHGGGFSQGSGGAAWYDGEQLARRENVVVISLNHRLNLLGFLHLAGIGDERFAHSGNVGLLDIVAALRWISQNIFLFGGNPDNVTLFGSSGGACKISALLNMPAAKGLFHKAILMSGVIKRYLAVAGQPDQKREITERLLRELDIRDNAGSRLQALPVTTLLAAMKNVQQSIGDIWGMQVFSPVVDGEILPTHPFATQAPAISAEIPLLIGSTRDEMGPLLGSYVFDLDWSALIRGTRDFMAIDESTALDVVQAYRDETPAASPTDIYFRVTADHHFRMDSLMQAEQKSQQQGAPVFVYLFQWESPAFGGKFGSTHGFEVPFAFFNLDKAPGVSPNTHRDQALTQTMAGAWCQFARTGSPQYGALPTWNPYCHTARSTMVFDEQSTLQQDPYGQSRRAMLRAFPNA